MGAQARGPWIAWRCRRLARAQTLGAMGCGASRCTTQQQDEVFLVAAKEMLLLCLQGALGQADKIKIALPSEVAKVRQISASLRSSTDAAKSQLTVGAGGIGAAAAFQGSLEKAEAGGGMLANLGGVERMMIGTAASLVDKAAEAIGKTGGIVAEKALGHGADSLENAVNAFEEPLSCAGRSLVQCQHAPVLKVYSDAIEALSPSGCWVGLVRGGKPHGAAQYKACSSDAVCAHFAKTVAEQLRTKLASIALDSTAKSRAKQDWDMLMYQYDQANQMLGKSEASKPLQQGPIELDLNQYILEQTLSQIGELMGKEEATLRADPAGKSRRPATFALCFSPTLDGHWSLEKRLPRECYLNRDK